MKEQRLKAITRSVFKFYDEAMKVIYADTLIIEFMYMACSEFLDEKSETGSYHMNTISPATRGSCGEITGRNISLRAEYALEYVEFYKQSRHCNSIAVDELTAFLQSKFVYGFATVREFVEFSTASRMLANSRESRWFEEFEGRWRRHVFKVIELFPSLYQSSFNKCLERGLYVDEAKEFISESVSHTLWWYAYPKAATPAKSLVAAFTRALDVNFISRDELIEIKEELERINKKK